MNVNIIRAMKGDHEAAKRCTAAGIAIPCPGCGNKNSTYMHAGKVIRIGFFSCDRCGWNGPSGEDEQSALLLWNIRTCISE